MTKQERAAQCRLLRDLVGTTFQMPTFDPVWRTEAVVSVARKMYEAREYSHMGELQNALEQAGCNDSAILSHCRQEEHYRGCWLTDFVLGNA